MRPLTSEKSLIRLLAAWQLELPSVAKMHRLRRAPDKGFFPLAGSGPLGRPERAGRRLSYRETYLGVSRAHE
jgi:hypothetical protein